MVVGGFGSAHGGEGGFRSLGAFPSLAPGEGILAPVVVADLAGALLLDGEGGTEVVVEIAAERGPPGECPANAAPEGLKLGGRGARDGSERHIVMGEVDDEAIPNGRAGGTARREIGTEHEVVDEELGAAGT